MRIAYDISPVIYGTGVSVYTGELLKHLLKIDDKNEYILFGGSLRRSGELKDFVTSLAKPNTRARIFPFAPTFLDLLWNKLHILPIDKFTGRVDVYHSSDWTQAPSKSFCVTTIHDLIPVFFPESSHSKIVKAHLRRLEWVKKEVQRVIVPSKETAKDAARYGIDIKKIRVIPEGISQNYLPVGSNLINTVKKHFGISGKYLLMVGATQRKNIKGVMSAFKNLGSGSKYKLVIIGEKRGDIRGTKDTVFLGHVEGKYMPALYSGAEVFLYPSFYEGFGLPILESFACKTPVVTSNLGSMKEVAGGAAVLVDPNDPVSISDGIVEAMSNKNLLRAKGIKRVKEFSWEECSRKTLEVYKECGVN